MNPLALLYIYCLLILLASLAGGWIPLWVRLTHSRMELASSFVAGLMLGVGLLHILPHAVVELGPKGDFDRGGRLYHWLQESDLALKGERSTPALARFELERLLVRLSAPADQVMPAEVAGAGR